MPNRVTIGQVAEHAGVSYQTVSRVINDRPEVAAETRARVLASIQALNYRPSQAARALSRQRTSIIGLVIPFEPDDLFTDPHLLWVVHGIARELTLHDYSLLLLPSRRGDGSLFPYQRLLKERLVDGVIVEGTYGDAGAQLLAAKGYPVVVVGYCGKGIPCVHPDDEGAAYNLAQHLIALGHRRIGVVAALEPARWQGFRRACRDAGYDHDPRLVAEGDYSVRSGYEAAQRLMQEPQPPTAILAFSDKMAIGAIRWLQEHGYAVPGDVSVTGFDDIPTADLVNVPLTTVNLCSADLGQRAVSLLLCLIEGQAPEAMEIVLPTRMIVRRSTAVAPTGGPNRGSDG